MKRKIIAVVIGLLLMCEQAYSAIGYVGSGTIGASTGADVTITLPAHSAGDIILLACVVRDVDDTITITSTGESYTAISPADRGTTSRYFFWYTKAATTGTTVLFDKSTTTGDTYCDAYIFSGCDATTPVPTTGSIQTTTTDPNSFTGITLANANSYAVLLCAGEDNNNSAITTTGTDPSAYTEVYEESGTGSDGVVTISYAVRTTAGATGTVSCDWGTAIPGGAGGILLELKEAAATGKIIMCD
jgi:hypothetical protein